MTRRNDVHAARCAVPRRAEAGQGPLWRYAGALGRAWRTLSYAAPEEVQVIHAKLLHAVRDELMPHVGQGKEAASLLQLLGSLAGASRLPAVEPSAPEPLEATAVVLEAKVPLSGLDGGTAASAGEEMAPTTPAQRARGSRELSPIKESYHENDGIEKDCKALRGHHTDKIDKKVDKMCAAASCRKGHVMKAKRAEEDQYQCDLCTELYRNSSLWDIGKGCWCLFCEQCDFAKCGACIHAELGAAAPRQGLSESVVVFQHRLITEVFEGFLLSLDS